MCGLTEIERQEFHKLEEIEVLSTCKVSDILYNLPMSMNENTKILLKDKVKIYPDDYIVQLCKYANNNKELHLRILMPKPRR